MALKGNKSTSDSSIKSTESKDNITECEQVKRGNNGCQNPQGLVFGSPEFEGCQGNTTLIPLQDWPHTLAAGSTGGQPALAKSLFGTYPPVKEPSYWRRPLTHPITSTWSYKDLPTCPPSLHTPVWQLQGHPNSFCPVLLPSSPHP